MAAWKAWLAHKAVEWARDDERRAKTVAAAEQRGLVTAETIAVAIMAGSLAWMWHTGQYVPLPYWLGMAALVGIFIAARAAAAPKQPAPSRPMAPTLADQQRGEPPSP
jgi:hypothetical protein